jgi:hypothetical protein
MDHSKVLRDTRTTRKNSEDYLTRVA